MPPKVGVRSYHPKIWSWRYHPTPPWPNVGPCWMPRHWPISMSWPWSMKIRPPPCITPWIRILKGIRNKYYYSITWERPHYRYPSFDFTITINPKNLVNPKVPRRWRYWVNHGMRPVGGMPLIIWLSNFWPINSMRPIWPNVRRKPILMSGIIPVPWPNYVSKPTRSNMFYPPMSIYPFLLMVCMMIYHCKHIYHGRNLKPWRHRWWNVPRFNPSNVPYTWPIWPWQRILPVLNYWVVGCVSHASNKKSNRYYHPIWNWDIISIPMNPLPWVRPLPGPISVPPFESDKWVWPMSIHSPLVSHWPIYYQFQQTPKPRRVRIVQKTPNGPKQRRYSNHLVKWAWRKRLRLPIHRISIVDWIISNMNYYQSVPNWDWYDTILLVFQNSYRTFIHNTIYPVPSNRKYHCNLNWVPQD